MLEQQKPTAAALRRLRPDDIRGTAIVVAVVSVTLAGLWLSLAGDWPLWLCGQVLLTLALIQWFVVLHECGHETLFRTRRVHAPIGIVAGFMSGIPFHCWVRVHRRHHKWTGWQDLDPTTESLVPRRLSRFERLLVNACWRCWIPLFSVVYRATNYWNLPKLLRLFPNSWDRRGILRDTSVLLATYGALTAWLGPHFLLRAGGLALLLSLILEDLLLLSQHTHIPQNICAGRVVSSFPAVEQEAFTRSIRMPHWVSWLLLHFDAHELHHMYPFVPGYHLRRIPYRPANEIGWWHWVRRAKQLRGEVLLFQNRSQSGWDI